MAPVTPNVITGIPSVVRWSLPVNAKEKKK